jgi:methylated-DNA-[protein]-cysteine S-methyltransferase
MTKHAHDLIAMVLGDAPAGRSAARWLATDPGRRELAAYEAALAALDALYRRPEARPHAYYCGLSTPIGRVFVAATPAGLVRVSFRQSETAFLADLRRQLGVEPVRSETRTGDVIHQLHSYFAGERRHFDVRVDLRHVSPFQRRVLEAAAGVPAGQVVSYGEIARRIGQPRGGRAVGQALGRNPVPIVIPCHRVVAAGGRIGGYTGGLTIKRKLLRLEGALAVG